MSTYEDIFDAAQKGTVEDVRYFVEEKYDDVNIQNDLGSPLHYATRNVSVDVTKYLVSHGANLNAAGYDGEVPLHWAARDEDYIEAAKYLISEGADVNAKTRVGYTLLHMAVGCGNVELVKVLISNGTNVNAQWGDDGTAPLHIVVRNNSSKAKPAEIEIVKYLILQGKADVNIKETDGMTPLHVAACSGNMDFVEILISNGADINAKNIYGIANGITPLHCATGVGESVELAKFLISKGADVNAKCDDGGTSLDYAKGKGNAAMVQYLTGLSFKSQFKNIFDAAKEGTVEDVRYFVEVKGVTVNTKDNSNGTPLHSAVDWRYNLNKTEKIQYLISKGADVNAKNDYGFAPLQYAACNSVAVVQLLASHGADVNTKDKNGKTPLHVVAESEHASVEALEYLISQGADVNAKTSGFFGKTPLQVANTKEKKHILREAMQR